MRTAYNMHAGSWRENARASGDTGVLGRIHAALAAVRLSAKVFGDAIVLRLPRSGTCPLTARLHRRRSERRLALLPRDALERINAGHIQRSSARRYRSKVGVGDVGSTSGDDELGHAESIKTGEHDECCVLPGLDGHIHDYRVERKQLGGMIE